jgi:hypothetical protein
LASFHHTHKILPSIIDSETVSLYKENHPKLYGFRNAYYSSHDCFKPPAYGLPDASAASQESG